MAEIPEPPPMPVGLVPSVAWARGWRAGFAAGSDRDVRKEHEDAELDAWIAAEKDGTDPGHQHCPECGCDPNDHTLHIQECRRGQHPDIKISCTNPDGSWNPYPGWTPIGGQVDTRPEWSEDRVRPDCAKDGHRPLVQGGDCACGERGRVASRFYHPHNEISDRFDPR